MVIREENPPCLREHGEHHSPGAPSRAAGSSHRGHRPGVDLLAAQSELPAAGLRQPVPGAGGDAGGHRAQQLWRVGHVAGRGARHVR